MEYDPEYLAAIELEQQRRCWVEIARVKAKHRKRERDYTPRRPQATSLTPRITYAAHLARHKAAEKIA